MMRDGFRWQSPNGKWFIEAVTTLPVRGVIIRQDGDWIIEIPWYRLEKGKIEIDREQIPKTVWRQLLALAEQAAIEAHITGPAFVMD